MQSEGEKKIILFPHQLVDKLRPWIPDRALASLPVQAFRAIPLEVLIAYPQPTATLKSPDGKMGLPDAHLAVVSVCSLPRESVPQPGRLALSRRSQVCGSVIREPGLRGTLAVQHTGGRQDLARDPHWSLRNQSSGALRLGCHQETHLFNLS